MGNRVAFITGCSAQGLGAELAYALHRLGWMVIASARNLSKLVDLQASGIECIQLDVLSAASIEQAAASLRQTLGEAPLDMLVNNAGAGVVEPLIQSKASSMHDIFDLNVFSMIAVSKAFLPLLQGSSRPMIVNHTSLGSIFAMPFLGVYNASKSAAAMLTRVLRMEMRMHGIKVIELKTGRVTSRFFQNALLRKEQQSSTPERRLLHRLVETRTKVLAIDASLWAAQVAKDMSKQSPPDEIWRGGGVHLARLASMLPLWIVDKGANMVFNGSRAQLRHKIE